MLCNVQDDTMIYVYYDRVPIQTQPTLLCAQIVLASRFWTNSIFQIRHVEMKIRYH